MGVGHRTDWIDRRAISRSIVDRAADRDALCIVGTAVLVRGGRVLCDSSPQRWKVSGAFGIARCTVTFLTEDSSEPRGGRKLDPCSLQPPLLDLHNGIRAFFSCLG